MNSVQGRKPAAFFSYVQADDEHDRGRLTELRRSLAAEVGAQLGEDFLIFQDRDDILWGQRWRERIDGAIDDTTLLIAVLTPRYFKSASCRSEVERFLEREQELGRADLILPLYYIRSQALEDGDDKVASALRDRQYFDWRDHRFDSFESTEVRRLIAELAGQIVSAASRAGEAPPLSKSQPSEVEAPGFVELVAEAEEAMPLFTETITDYGTELEGIARITSEKTASIELANRSGRVSAARLRVMRDLASELATPAERMEALAGNYDDQLTRVDGGIKALIERVPDLDDDDEIAMARQMLVATKRLAASATEGLSSLDNFATAIDSIMKMSSTVRPPLRSMKASLATIRESEPVFREWVSELETALRALDGRSEDVTADTA